MFMPSMLHAQDLPLHGIARSSLESLVYQWCTRLQNQALALQARTVPCPDRPGCPGWVRGNGEPDDNYRDFVLSSHAIGR